MEDKQNITVSLIENVILKYVNDVYGKGNYSGFFDGIKEFSEFSQKYQPQLSIHYLWNYAFTKIIEKMNLPLHDDNNAKSVVIEAYWGIFKMKHIESYLKSDDFFWALTRDCSSFTKLEIQEMRETLLAEYQTIKELNIQL